MIYLDNAATTKLDEICLDVIKEFSINKFFNPSALYKPALDNKILINKAKENIKNLLNTNLDVIFTSSGTESNNMVFFTTLRKKSSNIVLSEIEHPSVREAALEMRNRGYDVRFVKVDNTGKVDEKDFLEKIDENTKLVSVMHVCNETGVINDIKKLNQLAKRKNKEIIFHSDATQAIGKIKIDLDDLGVDLYSFSFHKINGPKGIGVLLTRKNLVKPLLFGGGQENNLRPSTENIAYIFASEKILKNKIKNLDSNYNKLKDLELYTIEKLKNLNLEIIRNDQNIFSPYIISFFLKNIRGEIMLHALEEKEIYVGTGSACSSNKKESSYVKEALNKKGEESLSMLRISFSISTDKEEIDIFIKELEDSINILKEIYN